MKKNPKIESNVFVKHLSRLQKIIMLMFMISSFLLVAFSRLELGDDIVYKFNVHAVCEPHVYPGDSGGLVFVELLSISRRDRRSDSEPAPP